MAKETALAALPVHGYVYPSDFLAALKRHSVTHGMGQGLQLDLSRSSFLDLQVVMLIAALASRLSAKRLGFSVELPRFESTCEFLAAWDFVPALEDVLGRPRKEFLDSDSLDRLSVAEDPRSNRYMMARPDEHGILQRLYSNKFFSIQSFRRQPTLFSPALAVELTKKWREALVERVLVKMLPKGPELFRSRIIFEAMMNAIRHPNATIIQTSSIIKGIGAERRLCLGFWDNGLSISKTLRRALKEGIPIVSEAFGSVKPQYWVYSRGSYSVVTPAKPPSLDSNDVDLLLASIFPGITSDPWGLTQPPSSSTRPGMGLYLIMNAAVSVFGGKVVIRSGRVTFDIQRSLRRGQGIREAFKVAARVEHMSAWTPGNLLWIEIPIDSSVEEPAHPKQDQEDHREP